MPGHFTRFVPSSPCCLERVAVGHVERARQAEIPVCVVTAGVRLTSLQAGGVAAVEQVVDVKINAAAAVMIQEHARRKVGYGVVAIPFASGIEAVGGVKIARVVDTEGRTDRQRRRMPVQLQLALLHRDVRYLPRATRGSGVVDGVVKACRNRRAERCAQISFPTSDSNNAGNIAEYILACRLVVGRIVDEIIDATMEPGQFPVHATCAGKLSANRKVDAGTALRLEVEVAALVLRIVGIQFFSRGQTKCSADRSTYIQRLVDVQRATDIPDQCTAAIARVVVAYAGRQL